MTANLDPHGVAYFGVVKPQIRCTPVEIEGITLPSRDSSCYQAADRQSLRCFHRTCRPLRAECEVNKPMKTKLVSNLLQRCRIAPCNGLIIVLCLLSTKVLAQTNLTVAPKWDASAAMGASVTRGNSDTLLFTITGRGEKKWNSHELYLGVDASYGENNDIKDNETLRGFAQFNELINERWYGYGRVEGLHDAIADVEYRFTLSPGIGYYFIKTASTSLSLEGGPGIIFEKQGAETHNYMIARIAEKFEHKFNDRVRVWEMLEFLPQVDNLDNYIVNGEVGVESALSKAWALRVTAQDTYDNEPAPGRKRNDFKLIASIAWKFLH